MFTVDGTTPGKLGHEFESLGGALRGQGALRCKPR